MTTNWTSWNRLLLALLLLLALRHDCLCKTMSCARPAQSSEHSCCDMAGMGESNTSVHVIQKKSVCSCSDRLVFNKPEHQVYSGSNKHETAFAQTELVAYLPAIEAASVPVRNLEQQNDLLKPSKIYLLNRAILD